MKSIHRRRLLKLIRHLERGKLGHPVFDFSCFNEGEKVNGCRTNGCAIGECPVIFPKKWRFRMFIDWPEEVPVIKGLNTLRVDGDYCIESASQFFGVSYDVAFEMFTPNGGLAHKARTSLR